MHRLKQPHILYLQELLRRNVTSGVPQHGTYSSLVIKDSYSKEKVMLNSAFFLKSVTEFLW